MHASVLIAKLATRITWPLTRLDRSRARLDPPVLCYHRVLPRVKKNGKQPPYSVTPEQFREQLRLLVSEGFVSLTLQEFCEAAADLRELPSRSVLITFDDGFNDNYLLAWPIAREFNMKLNLFVCTGLVAGNTLGVFDRDLKVERESQTAFPNLWEPLTWCGLRQMKRSRRMLSWVHHYSPRKSASHPKVLPFRLDIMVRIPPQPSRSCRRTV